MRDKNSHPFLEFYMLNITIAGEGLQNFAFLSSGTSFEQGGIFIVLHMLQHGFYVLNQGTPPPILVCF